MKKEYPYRKRVNSSLDKLRTLLPYQVNMKKDMASLLEQTVEYVNVMHKVLNENNPDCLGKVYVAYREKTDEIATNRKTMKRMLKRKLKDEVERPSNSPGMGRSSSLPGNDQSVEMNAGRKQLHNYYETMSGPHVNGLNSHWQQQYHDPYNQMGNQQMVNYAQPQNSQPIYTEAQHNSSQTNGLKVETTESCSLSEGDKVGGGVSSKPAKLLNVEPSHWTMMNSVQQQQQQHHQQQQHQYLHHQHLHQQLHANNHYNVYGEVPIFQEYTPPCMQDTFEFDPSKLLISKDGGGKMNGSHPASASGGAEAAHNNGIPEVAQQQNYKTADQQQQQQQQVYHNPTTSADTAAAAVFKAPIQLNTETPTTTFYYNGGNSHHHDDMSATTAATAAPPPSNNPQTSAQPPSQQQYTCWISNNNTTHPPYTTATRPSNRQQDEVETIAVTDDNNKNNTFRASDDEDDSVDDDDDDDDDLSGLEIDDSSPNGEPHLNNENDSRTNISKARDGGGSGSAKGGTPVKDQEGENNS